ncbi:hypothetical protein CSA56_01145 [candidate division KSB3 bacterium]|uniref:histidine kinase n=1 Tax=candidate division KSB3 bacterium TaxID=2044937 RepID=A0A2G6KLD2_9BACT|nr:MAG: hypothetical protein CSA56_01145 [candidate division KSB3 bacterium]
MTENTFFRQLIFLWKPIALIVFITVLIGNILVHLLVQKNYIKVLEDRYAYYQQTMRDIRETVLENSHDLALFADSAIFVPVDMAAVLAHAFQHSPDIFQLQLLNVNGEVLWGKEAQQMLTSFGSGPFRSPRRSLLPTHQPIIRSPMPPELQVLQLPIWLDQQHVGFIRGTFWMDVSQTLYLKIDTIILYMTLAAAGGMVVLGIFAAVNKLSGFLSWKQQQLEDSVVSLEHAREQLRRTKKELYISEKLASLGYLAAGIAHEIGNPLGAVLGYIELLRKGRLDQQKTSDILQRTQQEVERIRRILEELVNFSRPHSLHLQNIDVNQILRKIVLQLPSAQEKRIEITLQLTEFPLFAYVDEKKLQSAFLNIVGNAIDAIGTDGVIRISTSRRIRESSTMPGGSEVIAIQFSDSGCGIPKEMVSKIFDPFFTTKEPGKGMGLGLSLCHRMVETFHGEIDVESQPGKGTDVIVFLPPARRKSHDGGEGGHNEG